MKIILNILKNIESTSSHDHLFKIIFWEEPIKSRILLADKNRWRPRLPALQATHDVGHTPLDETQGARLEQLYSKQKANKIDRARENWNGWKLNMIF